MPSTRRRSTPPDGSGSSPRSRAAGRPKLEISREVEQPTPRPILDNPLALWTLGTLIGAIGVWQLRLPGARTLAFPWLLLVLGAACAAWGLSRWLGSRPVRNLTLPRSDTTSQRRRLVGYACLVAAVVITAALVIYLWPDYTNWHGVPAFWIASMLLVLVGAHMVGHVGQSASRLRFSVAEWRDSPRRRLLEIAAFILILGLAIFLRTYHLDSIPPGIYVDETNAGLDAVRILEGRPDSPFATGWYETPNGYLYYMALVFRVFGATWMGLKAASLIPAILTIPALYFLARELFGPLTAVCAMLLMAVSRWHLSMSRWGWNETAPPLFQILAFYFLIRGLRYRRALDYALSGVLSALAIYIYLSARLAAITLGIYVIYWFLSEPSGIRQAVRQSWRGVLLLLVAAAITLAPIAVTYITNPFVFGNRSAEISIFRDIKEQSSLTPLWLNVTDILRFFHQVGDQQGKHNLPGEPMMDPFTGLFFAIGVALALIRLRDHRNVLLVLWIVIGLAGSFLSSNHESPQAYRSLTALPGAILLAAVALSHSASALYWRSAAPTVRRRTGVSPLIRAALLVVAVLAGAALWESGVYFGRQASSVAVLRGFNPTENRVAHETIEALRENTTVYLSTSFSEYSPVRFLVYGVYKRLYDRNTLDDRPYQVFSADAGLPLPVDGQPALVLLDSTYWPLRDYFASLYPSASIDLVRLADDSPIYMRMRVAAADIAALQGLRRQLIHSDGTVDHALVAAVDPIGPAPDLSRATWDGAIYISQSGEYFIGGEGGLTVALDGRPWQGRGFLGRGLYRLHMEWIPSTGTERTGLVWEAPGASRSAVPAGALYHIDSPAQGLVGSYFRNTDWSGDPLYRQVTPFILLDWPRESPVGQDGPFSARFTGSLRITQPGEYEFQVQADDGARLVLDNIVIGEGLVPNRPNSFNVTRALEVGEHPLQIDYVQFGGGSGLRLMWRYGDDPFQPVPPSALIPSVP